MKKLYGVMGIVALTIAVLGCKTVEVNPNKGRPPTVAECKRNAIEKYNDAVLKNAIAIGLFAPSAEIIHEAYREKKATERDEALRECEKLQDLDKEPPQRRTDELARW